MCRWRVATVGFVVALVLACVSAATAAASSQITRALASPDWTKGSVAGSVTWDGCTGDNAGANCSWFPVALAEPSTYVCEGSDWSLGDPNIVRTVWGGGGQTANGTVGFDVRNALIVQGVYGQRLCLSVVWHSHYREPFCVVIWNQEVQYDAQHGLPPPPPLEVFCPIEDHIVGTVVMSKLFTVMPAPVIAVPGTLTTEAMSRSGAAVDFNVSATDGTGAAVSTACSPPSGSTFPIGRTTVNCSASDSFGTVGRGAFEVVVTHANAPVLSLPKAIRATTANRSGAIVNYKATAIDAVDGSMSPSCAPRSGSRFRLGTTTVTCTARDSAGNSSSATFAVRVQRSGLRLTAFALAPRTFRPVRSGPSLLIRGKLGTQVSYTLSARATVAFTVERATSGHRYVSVRGSFKQTGRKGANSFRFSGRIANRTLNPGNYRLIARATANGRTGKAQLVRFRLLR